MQVRRATTLGKQTLVLQPAGQVLLVPDRIRDLRTVDAQELDIRSGNERLRQFAHNAVMHRSYEGTNTPVRVHWFADRVEVVSPGGLHGRITPENFGTGDTDYRNPLLAEVMYNLGFAQRFGLGVPLAREALAANGNPEPEFRFENALVAVIVRAAP